MSKIACSVTQLLYLEKYHQTSSQNRKKNSGNKRQKANKQNKNHNNNDYQEENYLPWHSIPLPVKPSLHVQLNDPMVLLHLASPWQESSSSHSFISVNGK